MATRLNEQHRGALRALAERVVDCPDETKAEEAAYQKAAPLVVKAVEKQYPPADMVVLRKYELAKADACIRLSLTAGGIEEFTFRSAAEAPMVARHRECSRRILAADERASDAVAKWVLASTALKKARYAKMDRYQAFIRSAVTFEQVVEVWPEAAELAPRVAANLPVAVSEETLAAIKADSVRRLKAAKRAA